MIAIIITLNEWGANQFYLNVRQTLIDLQRYLWLLYVLLWLFLYSQTLSIFDSNCAHLTLLRLHSNTTFLTNLQSRFNRWILIWSFYNLSFLHSMVENGTLWRWNRLIKIFWGHTTTTYNCCSSFIFGFLKVNINLVRVNLLNMTIFHFLILALGRDWVFIIFRTLRFDMVMVVSRSNTWSYLWLIFTFFRYLT